MHNYRVVEYVEKDLALKHHGIRGMRWGVRRWQNEDGSLTPAGEERYGRARDDAAAALTSRLTDMDKYLSGDEMEALEANFYFMSPQDQAEILDAMEIIENRHASEEDIKRIRAAIRSLSAENPNLPTPGQRIPELGGTMTEEAYNSVKSAQARLRNGGKSTGTEQFLPRNMLVEKVSNIKDTKVSRVRNSSNWQANMSRTLSSIGSSIGSALKGGVLGSIFKKK